MRAIVTIGLWFLVAAGVACGCSRKTTGSFSTGDDASGPLGSCSDTQDDPSNCGSCGHVCPDLQICVDGGCTDDLDSGGCAPPFDANLCGVCGIVCEAGVCDAAVQTDPNNCGQCGNACLPNEVCRSGVCSLECDASLQNDPENCGACFVECASGVCENGVCADGHGG